MSATRHQFRPQLESFEERSLMASGITASFSQGVLSIMGTSACDRIIVNEAGLHQLHRAARPGVGEDDPAGVRGRAGGVPGAPAVGGGASGSN